MGGFHDPVHSWPCLKVEEDGDVVGGEDVVKQEGTGSFVLVGVADEEVSLGWNFAIL